MIKNEIRKKLLQEKRKRENTLIETRLVESRLKMIVESKSKFQSMKPAQQKKVFIKVMQEVNTLQNQGLMVEGLGDIFGKLFGQGWSSIGQTIVEPIVKSILGWFGIKGYFANAIASLIASDPSRLSKLFGDCRETTKLIVEALTEAMVMSLQDVKGMDGMGWNILRNAIGGAIKDEPFIMDVTNKMADGVCEVMGKLTGNAENVLNKVQGSPAVAQ